MKWHLEIKKFALFLRDQFLTSTECRRLHYGVDEEVFENEGIFWLNRFKNESEVFKKLKMFITFHWIK